MKLVSRIREYLATDAGVLVVLGLVSLVAFGIFVPFTGFYWDDWVWKFFSYAYESNYLLWQPVDRPLAGTLHVLLDAVLGDNPLNWQTANLFFRWANAAGFYLVLRKVLPDRKNIMAVVAVYFLIYPGFSEQWISIAFIHHLVPMTVLWFSFVFMFDALETQAKKKRIIKFGISIILAVLVMLTTEYFFGIEIFRAVLLLYYLLRKSPGKKLLVSLWSTIKVWWPFAVVTFGLVIWRATVGSSEGASYAVNISRLFDDGLAAGLWNYIQSIGTGMYASTVQVLLKSFSLPEMETFGQSKTILFYGLFIGMYAAGTWYSYFLYGRRTDQDGKLGFELVLLGFIGLVFGGQPFWVAGMQYFPHFPTDRLGLSLMMGASMMLIGIILLLVRNRWIVSVLLAALFAFGVGSNLLTGAAFAQAWEDQQVFWRQFVTRVPNLEPGTVLVTKRLPPAFMNDLSFMMTLNWLYDLDPNEVELQYGLFYSDSRSVLQTIEADMSIVYDRRMVKFNSDIHQTLVFYYSKNDCLTIFDGENGLLIPNSRHLNPEIIRYSDVDQIGLSSKGFENWPEFFDPIQENNWCYYYEKAELELQRENYAEVARLGDTVFNSSLDQTPKRPWERGPFVEGYAFMERWKEAVDLTEEIVTDSPNSEALLCHTWKRIDENVPEAEAKQLAIDQVALILSCE
jgi:hypothetical protein